MQRFAFFRILSALIVSTMVLVSCQLPFINEEAGQGLTLRVMMPPSASSRAPGSPRLLLPTASSLTVTLYSAAEEPLRSRTVAISAGSPEVSVSFGKIQHGSYMVGAEARDGNGILVFHRSPVALDLNTSSAQVSLQLVPAENGTTFDSLVTTVPVTGNLAGGSSRTWRIPSSARPGGSFHYKFSTLGANADFKVYVLNAEGATVSSSFEGHFTATPGGDWLIAAYNAASSGVPDSTAFSLVVDDVTPVRATVTEGPGTTFVFNPSTVQVHVGTPLMIVPELQASYPGHTWTWSINGTEVSRQDHPSYIWTPAAPGSYTLAVSATDPNLNARTGSIAVTVPNLPVLTYSNLGCDSGTPPAGGSYTAGTSVTLASNPASLVKRQDGITLRFTGWSLSQKAVGSAPDHLPGATLTLNSNTTLHAQWTVIGGTGPAGGLVFHDQGSVANGWRYLEAAPADLPLTWKWSSATIAQVDPPIGTRGKGYGDTSTNLIMSRDGYNDSAAKAAATYALNTYDDWYLPTPQETLDMYDNLHRNGLGNFSTTNLYWTCAGTGSTAWYAGFDTPAQGFQHYATSSSAAYLVRPVRAFSNANKYFTVTYASNDFHVSPTGRVPVDAIGYSSGQTVTVAANQGGLAKAGFPALAGWNHAANGESTRRAPGTGSFAITANTTLYADWGRLYVLGYHNGSPGYFINGQWRTLTGPTPSSQIKPFVLGYNGSQVIVAGKYYDDWHGKGLYWTGSVPTGLDAVNSWQHAATTAFDIDPATGEVFSAARPSTDSGSSNAMVWWRGTSATTLFNWTPVATPLPMPLTLDWTGTDLYLGGHIPQSSTPYLQKISGASVAEAPMVLNGGTAVHSIVVSGSTIHAVGTNGGTQAVYWKSTNGGVNFGSPTVLWTGSGNCAANKIILVGSDVHIVGSNGTQAMYQKNAEAPVVLPGGRQATSVAVHDGNVYVSGHDLPQFLHLDAAYSSGAGRESCLWINGSRVLLSSQSAETWAQDIMYLP